MTKHELKKIIKDCIKENLSETAIYNGEIIIPDGKTEIGKEASKLLADLITRANVPPVFWKHVENYASGLIKYIDDSQNKMIK